MNVDRIREILKTNNFNIVFEKRYKNYAHRFKLSDNTSIFCGDKGNIWYKGKYHTNAKNIISKEYIPEANNRVFIVYGHDDIAREELNKLLDEINIEYLELDKLDSDGNTIIEQLEKTISKANYGIVLATPDDIGYSLKDKKEHFRARQNVILELGMLFSKLGRNRVAIIIKKNDNFERPSDIDGILYLEYREKVSEIIEKLKIKLKNNGYLI